MQQTKILLLVGPTAAGKDSIKNSLLEKPDYHHIVSHTTRKPRFNRGHLESDGVEYHFITAETAKDMLRHGEFVEAKVYSANMYGTSVEEIRLAHDKQQIAVTDLEVQGVAEYKTISPNVMAVFIVPPGFEIWQDRLRQRYGDSLDVSDYKRRIQTAIVELEELTTTDYYTPVVNDEKTATAALIDRLVHGESLSEEHIAHAHQTVDELKKQIVTHLAELETN